MDITEHNQAEPYFRALLEAAPDAIVIVDQAGKIVLVNAQTEKLFGYRREELLSQPVEMLIPEPFRSRHHAHRADYLTDPRTRGMGTGLELYALRKDGSQFPVEISLSPIQTEQGILVSSAIRDITERKQIENTLAVERNLLRTLINYLPSHIFVKDTNSQFVIVNQGVVEQLGAASMDEVIGKSDFDFYPDQEVARGYYEAEQEILRTGEPMINMEHHIHDPGGGMRWILETKVPLRDLDGNITGIVGLNHNITERKEAEALRSRAYDFYLTLFEEFPTLVWRSDIDTKCDYFNRTWLEFTGRTLEQELGDGWSEGVHPDDLDGCLNNYRTAFEARQPFVLEYRLRHHSGEYRWVIDYGRPFKNLEGEFAGYLGTCYDISERKRAEEELQRSQHFLERVADTTPDVLYVYDHVEHRNIYTNREIMSALGYTPQLIREMGTDGQATLMHPDDVARYAEHVQQRLMMQDGEVLELESRMKHVSGEWRWMYTRTAPFLREPDGSMRQIIGVSRDITLRKKMEEELQQSQRFVQRIADTTPDVLYVQDIVEERTIYVNREIMEVLGYTAEQVLEMGPGGAAKMLRPDDLPQYLEQFSRLRTLQEGEVVEIEYRIKRADGEWRWIYTRIGPFLRDPDGSVRQIIGLSRDVTERKQAEEEVRQSKSFVERIANTSPDILYVFDLIEHRNVYINREVTTVLGYTPEQVLEMGQEGAAKLLHPDTFAWFPEHAQKRSAMRDGEVLEFEYVAKHASGEWHHFYNREAVFLRSPDGAVQQIIGVSHDITERKQAELEIRRLNADLQHNTAALEAANKELEAFAYSVSHDLRAPLRAIDGFSRILVDEYGGQIPSEAERYLQKVRNNTQQMGRLIDDLLTFSRLSRQPVKKQKVILSDLIAPILEDLRQSNQGRQIEFIVEEVDTCLADPTLLKQVLVNLLANAVKFTGKQSVAQITVGSHTINNQRVYYVKDNGVGFDMQYRDKLFGVFQRLHRAEDYEGTGVGLAIVKRIVIRHGGSIWAEGKLGEGATFFFTLEGESMHDG